jgi:hypothetical protein
MISPRPSRTTALRASDEERERVASALKEQAAEGRLSLDELSERLDTCYAARTVGELDSLVRDLPTAGPPARVERRAPRGGGRAVLVVIGLILALTVVPQVIAAAFGLVIAAGALVLLGVMLLVPLAVLAGVVYVVVRVARAGGGRR